VFDGVLLLLLLIIFFTMKIETNVVGSEEF